MAEALGRSPWHPSVPWSVAAVLRPWISFVGRLWGRSELARLGRQELEGLFSDDHFDISKIRVLGYAPQVEAREGLMREVHRWADDHEHT